MLTTIGSKRLWVESTGDGPPVVFVHGLGGTSTSFEAQANALSASHRVIRFDLEGHGRSPLTRDPNVASWADDLGHILDALPTAKASIIGHSLGTLVVQHFAATRPDRVDKTIWLAPLREIPESVRIATVEHAGVVRDQGIGAVADSVAVGALSQLTRTDRPELVGFVKELLLGQDAAAYVVGCEVLAKSHDPDLATISAPTLLITGSEDRVSTPERARDIATQLTDARVEIIAGAGHWVAIEAATQVTKCIADFLGRGKHD